MSPGCPSSFHHTANRIKSMHLHTASEREVLLHWLLVYVTASALTVNLQMSPICWTICKLCTGSLGMACIWKPATVSLNNTLLLRIHTVTICSHSSAVQVSHPSRCWATVLGSVLYRIHLTVCSFSSDECVMQSPSVVVCICYLHSCSFPLVVYTVCLACVY